MWMGNQHDGGIWCLGGCVLPLRNRLCVTAHRPVLVTKACAEAAGLMPVLQLLFDVDELFVNASSGLR